MNLLSYLLGSWLNRLDPTLLVPLQGKLIQFALDTYPPLYLHGVEHSLALLTTAPHPPDLKLGGSLLGLLQLAYTGRPNPQVQLQGDMELAQTFQHLLRQTPLLLEEQLAQWLGDIPVGTASGLARQSWADLQQAQQHGYRSLGAYLTHEAQLVPSAAELADFSQAVDTLRDDVARLGLRIQRLQAQHPSRA